MHRHLASALLAGTAAIALAAGAQAQTATQPPPSNSGSNASTPPAEGGVLGEVIVTAQRRDESLSKTPVSVSVISPDTLAKAQIVTEQDLRTAAPGLTIRSGISSNQLNFAIRGQSQDSFSNTRPGVLPYINDVQIGGIGGSSAFYDLQSVQVLKGPQGTLFGRSATGGAVLFETAKPTDTVGGYASITGGDYGQQKYEGAIGGPIYGDLLTGRIAAIYEKRDGFQYNLYDGSHPGGLEREGVRLSATAHPTSALTNETVVDYLRSNSESMASVISGLTPYTGNGGPPYIPIQYLYAGTATPVATATGECTLQAFVGFPSCAKAGVNPAVAAFYTGYFSSPNHPAGGVQAVLAAQQARGPYVIDSNGPNLFHSTDVVVTNTTTYEVSPDLSFKNTFGFTHLYQNLANDADGTPYFIAGSAYPPRGGQIATTRQISEEPQVLGHAFDRRLDYVGGFYFSDEHFTEPTTETYFDLLFGGENSDNAFETLNTTYAGYGQATYHLTDTLGLTAGARYTSETVEQKTLSEDTTRLALGNPPPPGYSYDQSKTYDKLSWTVGLEDQITPNLLLYASGRRAYKSGGYNGIVAPKIGDAAVGGNAFGAERVTDAEGGAKFKGRLFDIPIRADADFYYMWIKDAQRTAYTLVSNNPATLTVNVPSGETYGLESDFAVEATHWLTLGTTLNYTHATFGSEPVFVNGGQQVFDRVPDTPRFTGTVYGDITVPVRGDLSAFLHGDIYDQTRSYDSTRTLDGQGTTIKGYALADFRIGLQNVRDGWTLTANVKNAFNRTYYVGGLPTGEIYQVNTLIPGQPRTFTVEARTKF